jgi:hypothetical protein
VANKELKNIAITGAALVLGLPLLKKLSDSQRLKSAEAEEKNRLKYDVKCIKGTRRYTINLLTIRDKIYDAFYNADWAGITEDEETAINTLLLVPGSRIGQLSALYKTAYNKDLRNDFIKFLSNTEYKRVQSLLN